jgi:hypothetical protein
VTATDGAETLTPRELLLASAIAERVAELLRGEQPRTQLVDAATLARVLGVSRDCVYAHAVELGGQRIGAGPRGRLRFDLDRALEAWTSRSVSKESPGPESRSVVRGSTHRRRRRMGSGPELLPIRGATGRSDASSERS